jgi:hypothetical protein
MGASNKLGNNGGRLYSFLDRPVHIDCNFVVDQSNGNGFGVRSLKGSGVHKVYMNTTAAFTGTSHTSILIDGIASGTSSLMVGMPVQGSGIPVGAKIAQIVSSGSINLTVATTSSTTGSITYQAIGSPNPAAGYALIQLENNYNLYCGGFSGFVAPSTGGTIAINGTALTVGNPYIIASVGHGTAGAQTIAPVADVSGSLASTWFSIYDAYGNTFIVWFSVNGVGSAPLGVSGTLVQQSIITNETAANVGAKLVLTLENLLAAQAGNATAPSGVFSFTASGTTTVTVTSTQNSPFTGGAADGLIATGFTFAVTKYKTNLQNWQNVGLPPGVIPNVGASFIATTTGDSTGGGSTGLVVAPGVSGVLSVEVVGDPNQSIGPIPMGGSPNVGAWLLVQFISATSSSVTTPIATQPAQNAVCGMSFIVEAGSTLIKGD